MDKEDIHSASMFSIILFGVIEAMIMSDYYSDYGYVWNVVTIGVMGIIVIALIIYVVTSILIIMEDGIGGYVGFFGFLLGLVYLVFPQDIYTKSEILKLLEEIGDKKKIQETSLWKACAKGINWIYFVQSAFLFWFAGGGVWLMANAWREMDEDRVPLTVFCVLFSAGLFFWAFARFFGIKKRPDSVLDYVKKHEISFESLNQNFQLAVKCGSDIYLGSDYVFIGISKGMKVVAIKDIISCEVIHRWGSESGHIPLPYYWLTISAGEDYIMKYGILPVAFYKLKSGVETMQRIKTEE